MTGPHIQMLDDLGAEFTRVAHEHETASRGSLPAPGRRLPRRALGRRALAVALTATALLSGVAYAVPATRAAIEDLTESFAGWVAGDAEQAPGRALRPEDDAPTWVRERGGRLIAETGGVGLYVTRTTSPGEGTLLKFALGDSIGMGDSVEGWRERFDEHALVVLGPALVDSKPWDRRGRFPLLGLTARSVDRVELRYDTGPPLVARGLDGGFVLMADGRRALRELVAYDVAGRELERARVNHIDRRQVCFDERGCPPGRLVGP